MKFAHKLEVLLCWILTIDGSDDKLLLDCGWKKMNRFAIYMVWVVFEKFDLHSRSWL